MDSENKIIENNHRNTVTKEPKYITFAKKQIISITEHRSGIIDTRTGKPMKMYTIKLPSKEYRHTQFEKDSQGIERNNRTATFTLGEPYIFQNINNSSVFYTYPDPERIYIIYFRGHVIGKESNKNVYDRPEPLKITGKELIKIFNEAREISKEKKKQLQNKQNKENKQITKKKDVLPKGDSR